jgi:DNA-binding winged helix-turn-helix (wHTH) protein
MQVDFGTCRLDVGRRLLFRDGKEVRLTPKAFDLLYCLLRERPRAVSKEELTRQVWKDTHVTEDGLHRLMNEIRAAIGDTPRQARWIRTVHGYGYAFQDALEASPAGDAVPPAGVLAWGNHHFPLREGTQVIGRDPAADIPLGGHVISRRHARIVVRGAVATIEDLASKNGTFVGEQRLVGIQPLGDGDEIRIGDYILTFHRGVVMPTETRAV